ncbi:MAG: hypothetical protein ACOX8S_01240 [Christensenellales bacterium]
MFYNVFAPFPSIRFGTSDEFVMGSLREAPEALLHALDTIAQDRGWAGIKNRLEVWKD